MTQVRYCPQCGREVGQKEWVSSLYCNQCGFEYRKLQVINPPPTSRVAGCAIQAINNTQRFAQTSPVAFAVTATGVGATGIFVGPMVASMGKVAMIAGGVIAGLGILINDDESKNALLKAGGAVLVGGFGITGAGYVMTSECSDRDRCRNVYSQQRSLQGHWAYT